MADESPILEYDSGHQVSIRFKAFQRVYLTVYLAVMGADWIQGPYLYKLYQSYGLALPEIAVLFLTGFVSGAFAGTAVGSMADSVGRRRVCLVFCAATVVSLVLRLINMYICLFLSHIMSGMSTALLYSVFEAWYVSEHTSRGFPADWRARTFATATFLNGLVAICAGIVANALVDIWSLRAPYMAAMLLLAFAAVTVQATWSENYGETQQRVKIDQPNMLTTLKEGCITLFTDGNILVLGAAQTFFECSMYVFVLLYTPAVEANAESYLQDENGPKEVPFGYLFATLMLAVMLGSLAFQALERQATSFTSKFGQQIKTNRLLMLALGLASTSFWIMAIYGATSLPLLLLAYHIFEFTTGMYYPSISSLKAEAIPEETRASIMTLLRIPMNLGVGIILWQVSFYLPFFP
ncbi:uncharacterized protein BYT42DRAFT_223548 [Radiomyces spectabilis]|uniref:uncharacterized protein n=1 Tax=Radiomyces spectabilis TaxID=64574 RepID=UPI00221EF2B8|nr:uncharacterized protein BYT42DRAFT_223548 [Radiomyces spectabilis]KAI8388135.1 hypothetical protein BYT42DRAFT_223548 [Radiomyces spectabilis]